MRGMQQYVAEALRRVLYGEPKPPRDTPDRGEGDKLILGEECVFPLIRGRCGPAMRADGSERLDRILEEEDVDRALDSGGR